MRFVDTSFWYAMHDRSDGRHLHARAIARTKLGRLLTSTAVLGELWTLARRRAGHDMAIRILDRVSAVPNLEISRINDGIEDDAWRWLRSHPERAYSFVDATSFALMRARHVREALAFDGDFSAAGFVEIRAT